MEKSNKGFPEILPSEDNFNIDENVGNFNVKHSFISNNKNDHIIHPEQVNVEIKHFEIERKEDINLNEKPQ